MNFVEAEPAEMDPKRLKMIAEVRTYVNFLLRHVAIMTFKFNLFFHTRLTEFSNAMTLAEEWRHADLEKKRKKKGKKKDTSPPPLPVAPASSQEPLTPMTAEELTLRMPNFKVINEACVHLTEQNAASSSALKELLDLFGRMRGLLLIAGNLVALLNKNFPEDSEKKEDVIYYFTHWTGFCSRTFNCHIHRYPTNQLPANLTPQEVQFIVWPLAIRTAVYCATNLIKDTCSLVSIDLGGFSVMTFSPYLSPEEMLTMKKILSYFESKHKNIFNLFAKAVQADERQERLPKVDPTLANCTEPITMDTILLNFPHEIPTDGKQKKSKKGKKKK